MGENVKDYLYSLLTEKECEFISHWLDNNKRIPYTEDSFIVANVKITIGSAVTNCQSELKVQE